MLTFKRLELWLQVLEFVERVLEISEKLMDFIYWFSQCM